MKAIKNFWQSSEKLVVKRHKWFVSILLCLLIGASVGVWGIQKKLGLQAEYYANMHWQAPAQISRIDRTPHIAGTTVTQMLKNNRFSVRWTGWIYISRSGLYHFATRSDDGSNISINGQIVVDNGGPHVVRKVSGEIQLEKGSYPVEIIYFQAGGVSLIEVFWSPPGEPEKLLPISVLSPIQHNRRRIIAGKILSVTPTVLTICWWIAGTCFIATLLNALGQAGLFDNISCHNLVQAFLFNKWIPRISVLIAIIPILFILSRIFLIHHIPNNDYWGSLSQLIRNKGALKLFGTQNEHIVFVPNIMYYLNFILTKGDNRGLFIINTFLIGGALFFAVRLAALHGAFTKHELWLVVPLLSSLFFSPATADDWILSMGGIVWFSADFFLFATLYYVSRAWTNDSFKYIVIALLLALIGALSYSSGMFIMLAITLLLIPYALILKKRLKLTGGFTILTITYYLWWLSRYMPTGDSAPVIHNKLAMLRFVFTYTGNLFTSDAQHAFKYGVVGVFTFILLALFTSYKGLYRKNGQLFAATVPWIACMVFALLNMSATSLLRDDPMALRYLNITRTFWCGVFITILLLIKNFELNILKQRWRIFAKTLGGVVFIIVGISYFLIPMYREGFHKMDLLITGFQDQRLAALSMQMRLYDKEEIYYKISISPEEVIGSIPQIRPTGHIPFDNYFIPEYEYAKKLPLYRIAQVDCQGSFDTFSSINNDTARIGGYIACKHWKNLPKYILIADKANHMRGGAILMPPLNRDQSRLEEEAPQIKWQGFAKPLQNDFHLIAYAVLPDKTLAIIAKTPLLNEEP